MSGPVNLPGWVLSIPASLALHAVPAMLLLRLFTPSVPDLFVVDLSESPKTAEVQPTPTEPAKRPNGRPAVSRKATPSSPRPETPAISSVRAEAPAEHPAPPAPLAVVAPEPAPRVPEPPAQPPAAAPISPAPPTPVAAPEPMLPVADPPRPAAPAVDAVFATPTAASVERDVSASVAPPASASVPSPPPAATARVSPGASDGRQVSAGTRASTPGGGASDGHEAEYRAYLGLVRQRILEALRYPLAARQQGLVGTVYIEIVVQPNGAISDVKIISPSSHPILDQAALETVRRLPSIGFPPGLAPRQLRARLPVVFNLR